tara:strand:+ start:146 stop:805 length:660 start_codon:yes stop_codon:yes gene_type:complete
MKLNSNFYLIIIAAIVIFDIALITLFAPTEVIMGHVQKILYIHVPNAWVGFLFFFFVFIASIMYLITKNIRWDYFGQASGEIGVVTTTIMVISGAIWAKPVWGVWWTWDPKLTTSLIMLLMYIGYLMLRAYASNPRQGATFASVLGIISFVNVPIVYMASVWWRTVHPELIIGPLKESDAGLTASMGFILIYSTFAITILCVFLLVRRFQLRTLEELIT